ncbi:RNA-binding CRS1 / YhbY (CRM) domain protein [Trifolium repens]|nr:RNA-binding CRS1 / YhbY (CRM) domain protein [Trifolium repens]
MTATASSSSCHLLLVLRSQPPLPSPSSSSFISFLKPLFLPSSNITLRKFHLLPKNTLFPTFLSTPPSSSRAFSYTPPLSSFNGSSTSKSTEENTFEEEDDEETDFSEDEFETEKDNFEDAKVGEDSNSSPLVRQREERLKVELPNLSVKEKKELGSYAHSLGKKLKTQSVGKSGITPNLVTAFSDNLEANELLKIKIHGSCPSELDDVVKQLEEATSSVTVGQIGRTLILYRPSLSKLKVEEKKKQNQKLYLEKQRKRRLLINRSNEREAPKSSRRGSSWKVRGSRS